MFCRDVNPFKRMITPVYHWKMICKSRSFRELVLAVSNHNIYWNNYFLNLIKKISVNQNG